MRQISDQIIALLLFLLLPLAGQAKDADSLRVLWVGNSYTYYNDMPAIVQQMKQADILVFATPIYYYEMCGQMKTLLDRANPLYTDDYAFRDVYLLSAAADDAPDARTSSRNSPNFPLSSARSCACARRVSSK